MIHGTRAARRDETLRKFLQEARRIVLTEGLDGLTVGRLAKAVGYTPGALYRYFPSKGALLATIDKEILDGWSDALAALAQASPDPLATLLGSARLLARLSVDRREDFALIAATLADPRQLVEDLSDAVHLGSMRDLLLAVVSQIEAAGRLGLVSEGDPQTRALTWTFSLVGVLQLQKLARFAPDVFDPPALADALARDLLVGWGADRATLDASAVHLDHLVAIGMAALEPS